MANEDDPFERVVAREVRQRRRMAMLDASASSMRAAVLVFGALTVGWAVVLAGHWLIFPEPHWLVVLHTIGFVLTVGFWGVTGAAYLLMRRTQPHIYGHRVSGD